ncbi:LRR receptor serine/threonine-protein kinase SIK1 [Trifolium repens]|nr:LRR receptor serine/threonine-protein kinase SIK1 [Trifolium repens]
MVGQLTTTKPSRSDDVLDIQEQIRITNQIKAQFDAITPKRPIKPNRSEPETQQNHVDSNFSSHNNIPELQKLQSLKSNSQILHSSEGLVDAQDEFVETQYYNKLLSIDKQHHATGSGFIKAVREGGEDGYEIQLLARGVDVGENQFRGYKSNPATNDWVPNLDHEHLEFVSSKPNRSEST